MEKSFEAQRGATFVGIKEFATAAERLLKDFVQGQTKATVSNYPNERTIRFYISEGLLPSPSKKRGQSSVFRYRHLITLLVIKKLQSERLPISVIKTLITGRGINDLEKLFDERVVVFTDKSSLEGFVESSPKIEGEDVVVVTDSQARREFLADTDKAAGATDYLEELLLKRPGKGSESSETTLKSIPRSPDEVSTNYPIAGRLKIEPRVSEMIEKWSHIKITEGFEIHVSNKYRLPGTDQERQLLFHEIERALRSLKN